MLAISIEARGFSDTANRPLFVARPAQRLIRAERLGAKASVFQTYFNTGKLEWKSGGRLFRAEEARAGSGRSVLDIEALPRRSIIDFALSEGRGSTAALQN
jgi:hypothetical protein